MLKDLAPKGESRAIRSARRLRRTMTLPEVLVWRLLRLRPFGLKFRRQHPSGDYVLDFCCPDALLAIEIDGMVHDMGNHPERDHAREEWLAQNGIATLRVSATDVLRDAAQVTSSIVEAARGRLPLHHPAAPGGPPPRAKLGED